MVRKKRIYPLLLLSFVVLINYDGAGAGGVGREQMRGLRVTGRRPSNKTIRHTKQRE